MSIKHSSCADLLKIHAITQIIYANAITTKKHRGIDVFIDKTSRHDIFMQKLTNIDLLKITKKNCSYNQHYNRSFKMLSNKNIYVFNIDSIEVNYRYIVLKRNHTHQIYSFSYQSFYSFLAL